ncbi:histidine kinase [Streptacidiphilus sp. ASG 303]|uniref:sensor histidine kinase n=1 Tax=Streptacidiphilus sp. ASG 303 TaxID=2896847 RepID=UPI001E62A6F7|nr:histidine kinase [Streptacidiphilus sp. ASG 303]MCD0486334.1 histidine kinase [Streptacidiphilus sp. ASG 303]
MKRHEVNRADVPSAGSGASELAPRMAVAVTLAVLLGIISVDIGYVLAADPGPWRLGAATAAFAAIVALQLGHSFPRLLPRLSRHPRRTLGLQAALTFVPFAAFGQAWLGMPCFLAGSVLLLLPGAAAWPLFAAVVGATTLIARRLGAEDGDVLLTAISTSISAMGVFGVSRMTLLVAEVRRARAEVARLALDAERLRFARSLHEVLGLSLSLITMKCELVQGSVEARPDQARLELAEALRTSRQALADIRTVARGYRETSLAAEAEAAVSMLAAVGVRASARLDCGRLPPGVDAVLASVLREGLTNLLRHSRAERCSIEAVRSGRTVTFALGNDGAGRPGGPEAGSGDGGLGSLAGQLARIGGTLTAGVGGDGWFRLEASVALDEEEPAGAPARRGGDGAAPPEAPGRPGRSREPARSDPAPRTAAAITVAVLLGYFVVDAAYLLEAGLSTAASATAVPLLALITALQLVRSFPDRLPWADRHRLGLLVLQAVLSYAPFAVLGQAWLGLPGFVVGSVLLLSPPGLAWPLSGAAVAGNAAVLLAVGTDPSLIGSFTVSAVMCGLVVFSLSRTKDLIGELHRSRAEEARLAVAEERLRFARDLHDLMGFSLSTITLKCEFAYRLIPGAPARAQQEIAEILCTSRQALADIQAVAGGYHAISLAAEAEAARAVLDRAGVETTVRLDCGPLPAEVDTVLATVLREGVTNLLRHSRARRCVVTGERRDGTVRFTLANDGAPAESGPRDRDGGSGLHSLARRVRDVNGRLTAGPGREGWFTVQVDIVTADRATAVTAG